MVCSSECVKSTGKTGRNQYRLLELLERRGAEIRVETFAKNGHRPDPGEVSAGRYFIVLVTLIALQHAQMNAVSIVLDKIGIVIGIFGGDQDHMQVRSVPTY